MDIPQNVEDMPDDQSPVAAALAVDPPPAAAAAEQPSPIASVLDDGRNDVARLEVARSATAGVTPEMASRVLGLEMRTGLPGDFIAQDVDGVEKMVADRSFSAEEFRKSSPKFAAWLGSNPNHYAYAKEDLGFFGRIERAHLAFSEGIASVPLQEQLAGLINQEMDGSLPLGGTETMARIDRALQEQQAHGAVEDKLAYAARQVGYSGRQFVSTIIAGAKGAAAGGAAGAAYGSAVPGLGTAAGAAAGAEAGGLSASWLYSYNMERAFAYKDLRSTLDIDGKPMDATVARNVATGIGIINAAIEVGSDVLLARMIPGLGGLFKAGKRGVTQQIKAALVKPTVRGAVISGLSKLSGAGATEGLEEISQALVGSTGRELGQGVSGEQVFAPDSAAQDIKGALSQGADAFVGTTLTFGVGVGGMHFLQQLHQARIAENGERFATALGEGVDSKAFKNLPEKAQDAVRAIVKDGPLKTAFIDPGAWQEYWQKKELDPREVAAEVMGDTKAYDEAVKAGHEIPVPMENYARKIAVVPEHNKFFAQELRHEPGAMNGREARELFQKVEEEGQAFMSAEDEFKAQTTQESAAAVKADMLKQLKDAGVDDKTARTQSELAAGFKSLGERAGVDPAELYKRYGLKISNAQQAAARDAAGAQSAGETFMQRAKRVVTEAMGLAQHPTETPEFQAWFGESKIVDGAGKPMVVYHSTAVDKNFDMFKRSQRDVGIHFGTKGQANDRQDYMRGKAPAKRGTAERTYPVYLAIKKPLRLGDIGAWDAMNLQYALTRPDMGKNGITNEEVKRAMVSAGYSNPRGQLVALRDLIKSKGYDGIVYKNTGEVEGSQALREKMDKARDEMYAKTGWPKSKNGFSVEDQKNEAYSDWIVAQSAEQEFRETNGEDSYIAFDPEQIKSAIGNSGAFSPTDARILFQKELPYKPMPGLTAEQSTVEKSLATRLAQPDAAEAYAKLPGTLGGKLLNVDEARALSPEYAADKAGATKHTLSTQRPSGAFIEQRLAELLAEPGEGTVLFMAGGGGSGKTTVSSTLLPELVAKSDIVFDSVFANLDKSIARVEAALASGRDVAIAYVHRDALEAARDGVAGRFDLTGRWVPSAVLAEDHVKAQQTMLELAERYKDDERVSMQFFENRTGQQPREITLDELRDMGYTNSDETAVEATQRLLPSIQKALKYVEQKADEAAQDGAQRRGEAGQAQELPRPVGQERADEPGQRSEDRTAADELTLAQGADDGARGHIRFGPNRQVNLDLLRQANASTFVHELWHFYFEVMADLADELARLEPAKRTRGQQGIISDYETLLKHVGAANRAGVTDAMHEEVARLGEAYVMKGNAPTSELRRAFARFKVWLTHIYRDIRALAVNLKPEVSKVFDRLLATEDELAAAEAEQNVAPLFDDPAKLLGEKDAATYLDAVAAAKAEAEEELSAKVLADVEREQQEWWKEQRAAVRVEIEAEVNAQPVYKALMALQSRDPEAPQMKLDAEAVKQSGVMEDTKRRLPRGITAKEGGVAPAVVAEMFGFKSAYELLDALAAAAPRRELIDKLADQRMVDLHGDLAQEAGRMHDEALAALHNKKRSTLLHRELEILAEKYMPSFKGLAYKLARRVPTIAAVRQMAEGMIGAKTVKEINPALYLRAEGKAGREALEAMLKGDFDTAFAAQYRKLLNQELFRAAAGAREDIDKSLEGFKKMARKDTDLAKTRDLDLVNAARAILASFGIGKKPKEGAVSYLEQMARYDPDMHETVRVLVAQAAGVGSYENSTYADFIYLKDAVDALWDLSKRTKQIMIDGKLLDRTQVAAELSNRIGEISAGGRRAGYDRAVSTWEKAKIGLMGLRASLRRVESWVSAMDSLEAGGVFRRYIWTPMSEAIAAYRLERRAYLERYLGIVKGVEKSLTPAEIAAPEIGYTFANKAELLGALLHSGNESNLSKLLRGRGWGSFIETEDGPVLDRVKWDAFIARAQSSGILAKADYDYAQSVWNLFEELKPKAQKVHKEMYGFYFGEVTAKEFDTPWGKFKGGYVPAKADPFMAADAQIRQEKEQLERGNNSFAFPSTGRGFTKGRVDRYAAPLMMDVRFIPGHIDWILRFVNIEPRAKDIGRLVMDREFRKVLDGFDQTVGGDMLVPWLQRSSTQRIETPSQGFGGRALDAIFRAVRSRAGLNVMFANVSNALQQPFDLSRSMTKVGAANMRRALWDFMRRPAQLADEIAAKSEFMATRETAKVMEVQRTIDDMLLNPTRYEEARKFAAQHGYFLQAAMQNQVDTVTWAAAYDKATAEGLGEREAVRFADSVVRETQGSLSPEDVSRAETGTPVMRAFMMFYNYFNMQANLLGTEFAVVVRDVGLKKGAGRLLYVYAFGFMIPAIMGEAVVKAFSGDKFDEDDDGYLDDALAFFFGSQVKNAAAMLPGVGPAFMAGINAWNKKWYDDRISTSPAVSMIESSVSAPHSVYQAYHDKAHAKKAIRDTLTLIGMASGLPAAAAAKPLGYLADVNAGKAKPTGPIDFARGLISGKAGRK